MTNGALMFGPRARRGRICLDYSCFAGARRFLRAQYRTPSLAEPRPRPLRRAKRTGAQWTAPSQSARRRRSVSPRPAEHGGERNAKTQRLSTPTSANTLARPLTSIAMTGIRLWRRTGDRRGDDARLCRRLPIYCFPNYGSCHLRRRIRKGRAERDGFVATLLAMTNGGQNVAPRAAKIAPPWGRGEAGRYCRSVTTRYAEEERDEQRPSVGSVPARAEPSSSRERPAIARIGCVSEASQEHRDGRRDVVPGVLALRPANAEPLSETLRRMRRRSRSIRAVRPPELSSRSSEATNAAKLSKIAGKPAARRARTAFRACRSSFPGIRVRPIIRARESAMNVSKSSCRARADAAATGSRAKD